MFRKTMLNLSLVFLLPAQLPASFVLTSGGGELSTAAAAAGAAVSQAPQLPNLLPGAKRVDYPQRRTTYVLLPGRFTQEQGIAEARRLNGDALVFSDANEYAFVQQNFPYTQYAPYWTGMYQDFNGREPTEGWRTVTGEPGYWLWNGRHGGNPDDGCKSGVKLGIGGLEYGKHCKNEDGAVVWKDADGRLEDVSVNAKYPVLVEIHWNRR